MPKGYYPDSAAISIEDWGKIVSYFYDEAPDSLLKNYPPIATKQTRFEVKPSTFPNDFPPVSSLVQIDPANHAIYIAHGTQLKIKSFQSETGKSRRSKTYDRSGRVNVRQYRVDKIK